MLSEATLCMELTQRWSSMTKQIFFDTDCLSSFLWVKREDIIVNQFAGQIMIPKFVYVEMENPFVQQLKARLDTLIANGSAGIVEIQGGTSEAAIFCELTNTPQSGRAIIGKGEAAAIALAKEYNGMVASNNLRDVAYYISLFGLELKTTADILCDSFSDGYITLSEADAIWIGMLAKKRKLPAISFSDYLRTL